VPPDQPPPRFPHVTVPVPPNEDVDEVVTLLFELGATGTEEQDATTMNHPTAAAPRVVVGWFETGRASEAAAAALAPRFEARAGVLEGDDWREGWRAWFEPRRVGPGLWVRPPWKPPPRLAAGDRVVTVDPGRAFGTGTHETTRLLLAALARRLRGGERVLDVGSGSGILGVAALILGAARVVATDVDPTAAEATRETAAANGVGDRLEASTTPLAELPEGTFDVVLANIEASVLVGMRRALGARVGPGGWLGLSGILASRADEVRAAFTADGALRVAAAPADGDWAALVLSQAGSGPGGVAG